jgi:glycoside/pentoside/hexuronide:cation symporter, GPH family
MAIDIAKAKGGALPLSVRLGYSSGDFGFNLFFTTASLYLLYYYTDVLGLSPATAGWVFAGALIWDAVFDPIMGYVATKTRTRWGRYRPYLLFGGVPLAISWTLMFLPVALEGTALVVFAAATHVLFRSCYAVVSMPYLALSAVMTSSSNERGILASLRMLAAATCGLLCAFFTLKLVALLGGGREGFFHVSIIYGAVACVMFAIVFRTVREEAISPDEPAPNLRQTLIMVRSNRAFWIVCAAMLLGGIGGTVANKMLPYYFKYALHREDLIGPALGASALAIMISIPVWSWVMKRWSKRAMWISGMVIGVTGYTLFWFAPADPQFLIPVLMVMGFGGGAGYIGFWAMMPDTVEYGEWRSGFRSEGGIFGIVTLIQKAALGLAAAALGELLGAIGYVANQTQSAETLWNMKAIMIIGPACLATATAVVIGFYPLSAQLHARLVRVLERRRKRSGGMGALVK